MNRQAQRYRTAADFLKTSIILVQNQQVQNYWTPQDALDLADTLLALVEATGPVVDEPLTIGQLFDTLNATGIKIYGEECWGNWLAQGLEKTKPCACDDRIAAAVAAERGRIIDKIVRENNWMTDHDSPLRYVTHADIEALLEVKE